MKLLMDSGLLQFQTKMEQLGSVPSSSLWEGLLALSIQEAAVSGCFGELRDTKNGEDLVRNEKMKQS